MGQITKLGLYESMYVSSGQGRRATHQERQMGTAVLEAFGLAKTTTSMQRWHGYAGVLLCETNVVNTLHSKCLDWPRRQQACKDGMVTPVSCSVRRM